LENGLINEVLLVEDNPADAHLIQEIFEEFEVKTHITIVQDGVDAIDYLNKNGKFKDRDCTSIIILDLNLPKKDGRNVLKEIKMDEKFRRIPVIVFTTSNSEQDVMNSYYDYASAFLSKPADFDEFVSLIKSFEDFWFKWTTLPKCKN